MSSDGTSRGSASPPPSADASSSSSNTGKCPVCLEELEEPTTAITCGHVFCRECIQLWVAQRNRCPLCRSVVSRLRRQQTDPTTGRTVELFDEVPAPPESTGYIIDRGFFTMVVTPVDSPLVVVEPVPMPNSLLVRYATRQLPADNNYIMPHVIPGTLFVMPDALPQVVAILESAGITQIETGIIHGGPIWLGITQHASFLDLHQRHDVDRVVPTRRPDTPPPGRNI